MALVVAQLVEGLLNTPEIFRSKPIHHFFINHRSKALKRSQYNCYWLKKMWECIKQHKRLLLFKFV